MSKKTGFTCGAMDLLHAGHVLMLKECRKKCDYLIVGLQEDPSITAKSYRGKKKNKPIETIKERLIRLQGCKYVDKIVIYKTEEDLYKLLKKIKPDIRFLGADWKNKYATGQELAKKIVYTSRNHNYSSSNLRKRLVSSKL
jgi:glycerol-3-phosphate cytidylyltransferase